LEEVGGRLQFERLELRVEVGRPLHSGRVFFHWNGDEPSSDTQAVWTVPVKVDSEALGTLTMVRSLRVPVQFDSRHLVNALDRAFAPRLHDLLRRALADERARVALTINGPTA
jgi:hypothetical protein